MQSVVFTLLDCFLLVYMSVFAVLTLCIMTGTIAELVPVFNKWLMVTFCHLGGSQDI